MLALVHISVFSLFHPTAFTVRPAPGTAIVVETNQSAQTLEGAQARVINTPAQITGRNHQPATFVLTIPGKITREYLGKLEIRRESNHLLAIVEMDIETAVASIVEGESPGSSPEARKAQAVAARSYLIATHNRHTGYDFCDTTHCQYLKGASHTGSIGGQAAQSTRGLVLTYQGKPIPALYSADCGGHTKSLKEAGWDQPSDYPYFPVECPIKGPAKGHSIGLCQRGAIELARQGKTFREILAYYFPATVLASR